MNPRPTDHTQSCSPSDAVTRVRHARKFFEVAELIAGEGQEIEYSSQAAALAVLAGVAASDAACCKALGRRSRGQDHRSAANLLEEVEPGGKQATKSLNRLLHLKDTAHYGLSDVGGPALKSALRQANNLIVFAERVLQG